MRFLIKRDSRFPLGGGALDAYERTTRKLLVSIISWPFDDLTQVKPAQTGSPHALNLTAPPLTWLTVVLGRWSDLSRRIQRRRRGGPGSRPITLARIVRNAIAMQAESSPMKPGRNTTRESGHSAAAHDSALIIFCLLRQRNLKSEPNERGQCAAEAERHCDHGRLHNSLGDFAPPSQMSEVALRLDRLGRVDAEAK